MQQYLLWFGALISLSASAYAIKCYACESVYEESCGEDFEVETHFKYDCSFIAPPRFLESDLLSVNATACLKRVFKENGVRKIVRGCFFGEVNATDVGCKMDPTLTAVQNVSCHVCDNENFCNGAEAVIGWNGLDKWKLFSSLVLFLLAAQVP
ncbi:UPAR/Ly6 domain-containing protein CG9338 [Drosophila bipectinata]|uniref:UPAR/Ly6 domain-containing protein CG9338 n=1 Tax=Drosophila bipectinata TaxID=42026 RepID=UPI001C8AAEA7|nr:uncharacterized protein LOC108119959 [Drosophila bipectinata]KAH8262720.1 hypothetical protein KR026_008675 [Drosophila bipectinata]